MLEFTPTQQTLEVKGGLTTANIIKRCLVGISALLIGGSLLGATEAKLQTSLQPNLFGNDCFRLVVNDDPLMTPEKLNRICMATRVTAIHRACNSDQDDNQDPVDLMLVSESSMAGVAEKFGKSPNPNGKYSKAFYYPQKPTIVVEVPTDPFGVLFESAFAEQIPEDILHEDAHHEEQTCANNASTNPFPDTIFGDTVETTHGGVIEGAFPYDPFIVMNRQEKEMLPILNEGQFCVENQGEVICSNPAIVRELGAEFAAKGQYPSLYSAYSANKILEAIQSQGFNITTKELDTIWTKAMLSPDQNFWKMLQAEIGPSFDYTKIMDIILDDKQLPPESNPNIAKLQKVGDQSIHMSYSTNRPDLNLEGSVYSITYSGDYGLLDSSSIALACPEESYHRIQTQTETDIEYGAGVFENVSVQYINSTLQKFCEDERK